MIENDRAGPCEHDECRIICDPISFGLKAWLFQGERRCAPRGDGGRRTFATVADDQPRHIPKSFAIALVSLKRGLIFETASHCPVNSP